MSSEVDDSAQLIRNMVPTLRTLAPGGLVAGILPVVTYNIIRPHLTSDVEGLLLILVFPAAEIAFERRRAGRFEPIGVISMVGIALGVVAAALFNGSTLLLKVRTSTVTGGFGVACLVSLVLPKPAIWYVSRAFAAEGHRARKAKFDDFWSHPGVPARFRVITGIWAVSLIGEAAGQVTLAFLLSTGLFLTASLTLSGAILTGLIITSRQFVKASEPLLAPSHAAVPT